MSWETQAKAAMDEIVAGPGSEAVEYQLPDGQKLSIRAQVDYEAEPLGDFDRRSRPILVFVSRSDVSTVTVGRDLVVVGTAPAVQPYRVEEIVSSDATGYELYCTRQ